ncbi:MAG: hypothetical protein H5U08_06325 [Thermogutta sp.]|uniref:hypothetical protein n=1 Tax=Thermogutta sp. TaxID=1962930 RepID=UPI0019B6977D|nr:hypothetical protein [Thermogutta sp.]MBC7351958.1 hypothetical protein [Thermogutta sp.]
MHRRFVAWLLIFLLGISIVPSRASAETHTVLGIEGSRFTINGEPTFLLGISYYGGLGAPRETWTEDLREIKRLGLNWIRIWANWAAFDQKAYAVDPEGNPWEPGMLKLREIVGWCDAHGMIVDITLSRGNGVTGPRRLQSLDAHLRAVRSLVEHLKDYRNWYLDLSNERNIRDSRFTSIDDLGVLRREVRSLDSSRLVTASHAGDIPPDMLREYVMRVGLDFIAPHRPRNAQSVQQTEAKTREYLDTLQKIGKIVPVHYQEPFRRDFGSWQPSARDFVADLEGAFRGGAAGWCFHNGDRRAAPDGRPRRSFDLRDGRLFAQLDSEEKNAVELITEFCKKNLLQK